MKKFEFLPQTADVKIKSYGKDLDEIFENAALGMFEAMLNTKKVKPLKKKIFKISSESLQALLYDFLNELLVSFELDNLAYCKFKVKINGNSLVCEAYGEKYDPKKHESRTLIKAVTFNDMEFGKNYVIFVLDA